MSLLNTESQDCILWPFSLNKQGYGQLGWDGRRHVSASRVMMILASGKEHDDLHAAHKCGNRQCVNPNHIYWATPKQNCHDKWVHGTMLAGAKSPSALLTAAEAVEIRYDDESTAAELADKYGICVYSVSLIKSRKTYKNAEVEAGLPKVVIKRLKRKNEPTKWASRLERRYQETSSDEARLKLMVLNARFLHAKHPKKTRASIAKETGENQHTIRRWLELEQAPSAACIARLATHYGYDWIDAVLGDLAFDGHAHKCAGCDRASKAMRNCSEVSNA